MDHDEETLAIRRKTSLNVSSEETESIAASTRADVKVK